MTLAEKILASKGDVDRVVPGEIVLAAVDLVMGQDGTAPLAIRAFEEMGGDGVFDPERVAFVIDHSAPSPSAAVSELHAMMRAFAREYGIVLYDAGEGVCHQLMPERGHVGPGDLVIGADSHTCTYGALGAFATGVGSTDLAAAMISGQMWFRVPETIKVELTGAMPPSVYAKDIILALAGLMTADGATYKALEFHGDAADGLSIEGRMTVANMAIELGAKVGLFLPDHVALAWAAEHGRPGTPVYPDEDAQYESVIRLDVDKLAPQIAQPHRVDNVTDVADVQGLQIHQAFLGTCTNGRIEDLQVAASILQGRHVHPDVRLVVAPASRTVLLEAIRDGTLETLIDAGAAIVTPGCGCCVGTHNGIPGDGERVISTANRNFKGRMGNANAEIYLASPATVAASAMTGEITDPRTVIEESGDRGGSR